MYYNITGNGTDRQVIQTRSTENITDNGTDRHVVQRMVQAAVQTCECSMQFSHTGTLPCIHSRILSKESEPLTMPVRGLQTVNTKTLIHHFYSVQSHTLLKDTKSLTMPVRALQDHKYSDHLVHKYHT
jgi:hypothetical protein